MYLIFTDQIAAQRIAELHQQAERWRVCQLRSAEAARPRRRGRVRLTFRRSRPVAA